MERHHADAAVPGVGCNQRLQHSLLLLRADPTTAPTPSSTQGSAQGLQGLPREGWAQAGLLAPVLTQACLPSVPILGLTSWHQPPEDQCTPVPDTDPWGWGGWQLQAFKAWLLELWRHQTPGEPAEDGGLWPSSGKCWIFKLNKHFWWFWCSWATGHTLKNSSQVCSPTVCAGKASGWKNDCKTDHSSETSPFLTC